MNTILTNQFSNVFLTYFYYIKILNKFVSNLPMLNRWCDDIPHHLVVLISCLLYYFTLPCYNLIILMILWGALCLGISCFDLSKFLSLWHLSLVVFYKTCKFWHLFPQHDVSFGSFSNPINATTFSQKEHEIQKNATRPSSNTFYNKTDLEAKTRQEWQQ